MMSVDKNAGLGRAEATKKTAEPLWGFSKRLVQAALHASKPAQVFDAICFTLAVLVLSGYFTRLVSTLVASMIVPGLVLASSVGGAACAPPCIVQLTVRIYILHMVY